MSNDRESRKCLIYTSSELVTDVRLMRVFQSSSSCLVHKNWSNCVSVSSRPRRCRPSRNGCILTHLRDILPLAVQIIDQQVFTQVVLICIKGAAMVDRRELIHKGHHPTIILQHKGINGDPLASTSLHL